MFTSSIKREIKQFSARRSHAVTAKLCTKMRDAGTKLLFCFKSIAFFPVIVAVAVSLRKLLKGWGRGVMPHKPRKAVL